MCLKDCEESLQASPTVGPINLDQRARTSYPECRPFLLLPLLKVFQQNEAMYQNPPLEARKGKGTQGTPFILALGGWGHEDQQFKGHSPLIQREFQVSLGYTGSLCLREKIIIITFKSNTCLHEGPVPLLSIKHCLCFDSHIRDITLPSFPSSSPTQEQPAAVQSPESPSL